MLKSLFVHGTTAVRVVTTMLPVLFTFLTLGDEVVRAAVCRVLDSPADSMRLACLCVAGPRRALYAPFVRSCAKDGTVSHAHVEPLQDGACSPTCRRLAADQEGY